ncbi:MAG: protein kinase domain-containing protein, partial [Luteimonas sp.]
MNSKPTATFWVRGYLELETMLNRETWQRLKTLFDNAAALPVGEQEAFARTHASDDPELLDELLSMLDSQAGATRVLAAPMRLAAEAMVPGGAPELPAGTRFGPWATRSLLGAGGMGQVYLGCRADGAYEREVAIKLMGAGALDMHHRVLFDHECRVLARMEHPAIAQIHDAGAGDEGRPYLVMEYIRGEPIDRWCDHHRLSMRARVELLATVCEGVLHAHQKGVIHRDLKPSNVLVSDVDGQAAPKIIDFGIALHGPNADDATGSGGTPGYASPEQMGGCTDVDVRTDVYSLGALLYALACGSAPRRDEGQPLRAPSAVLRALPPRELAARAAARNTTPRRLLRELEDGLDAVALKALQADRQARYASASTLLEDLGRWLAHYRPSALEGGRLVGLRKLVHRNRLAFAAGSVVVVALVAALVTVSWSLGEARREEQRARVTADFLRSMLRSVDSDIAAGLDKTLMLRVLEEASVRATRELSVRPDVLADMEMTIGGSMLSLGEYPRAVEHLENVRRIAADHPRQLREKDLEAIQALGQALVSAGRFERAEAVLREGIPAARRQQGADSILAYDMQSRLAWVLRDQGRMGEALVESTAAFEALSRLLPPDAEYLVDAGGRHVVVLGTLGHYDEAIALIRRLIDLRTAELGPDHTLTLVLRNSLAVFLTERGDSAAAETEMHALLEANLRLHGADSEYTLIAHLNLATAKQRQGKVAEAGPHYRKAMDGLLALHGPDHHYGILSRHLHADWLLEDGQVQHAFEEQENLLGIARRSLGESHPVTAQVLRGLAAAELALGRLADAHRHAVRAVEIKRGIYGDEAPGPLREFLETLSRVEAAGG